jgi:hypothetical protein
MGWVVNAMPRPLYRRERVGIHSKGGWVDPSAGLDGCGKSPHSPPKAGFDPRTIKPVASRYTDSPIWSHGGWGGERPPITFE